MSKPRTRGWYWKEHGDEYTRASVGTDIEKFVGWDTLLELIHECENTEYQITPVWENMGYAPEEYQDKLRKRDQALIAALFLTGGRASEVAGIRVSNFNILPTEIHVEGMRVLKRYKVVETIKNSDGSRTYITEPMEMTRGIFSINRDEVLVPYLLRWIQESEDYLFPSPSDKPYLSRQRIHQIVKEIGKRIGLRLWVHWFRSQRASQLATEYGFTIHQLADWFRWSKLDTARTYTKLDASVFDKIYATHRNQKTQEQRIQEQAETIEKLLTLVPPEKLAETQLI